MLTISEIKGLVFDIVTKYPVKKLSLFGSYADGNAKDDSDIDMLVEFFAPYVSLFMLSDIKEEMEFKLKREVDLIHAPIEENSLIKISKVVDIFEQ